MDSTHVMAAADSAGLAIVALANLRKIFGGRLGAYETLLERARREAILRLKEQSAGAHLIVNLRLETCTIARTKGRQGIGAVEVLAYGTAVRYA